ncbi:MAG TPA: HAD-IA family hydrolase [Thermotogota bacterium]|nr:HAD-IA family hydrolase [Thermotogota bacterium]HPR96987.1 HAD-IA family hydrolase [Thermotogota bacterium]
MENVEVLWFDLGYTLVKQDRERHMRQYLYTNGYDVSHEFLEKAYHLADKKFMRKRHEYGEIFSIEFYKKYLSNLVKYLEIKLPPEKLIDCVLEKGKGKSSEWHCFEYTHETLGRLKNEGYILGLLSNWDENGRNIIKINELDKYFKYIIISSELGFEKPDKKIFEYALNLCKREAEKCLYIGDNFYDDVIGSSKVGMNSILINRFGSFGIEEIDHFVISGINELPEILKRKISIEHYQINRYEV